MSQKRLLEDAIAEEEEARKAAAPEPLLFESLNIVVYHAVDLSKAKYFEMCNRIKGKFHFSDPQPGGEGQNVYTEDGDFVSAPDYEELYIYRYPEGDDETYALLGLCILSVGADDTSAGWQIHRSIKKWYRRLEYDTDWSKPVKALLDRVYAEMLDEEAGITHKHCSTSTVTEVRDIVHYSVSRDSSMAPSGLNISLYYGADLPRKQYKTLKKRCAGVFEFKEPATGGAACCLIERVSDGSIVELQVPGVQDPYPLSIYRYLGNDKEKHVRLGLQVTCAPAADLLEFSNAVKIFDEIRTGVDYPVWQAASEKFFSAILDEMLGPQHRHEHLNAVAVYERK